MSQEFSDELEALQAVYSDLSSEADNDSNINISLSCVPRSSSTSFVLIEVNLIVPVLYPKSKPSFRIGKSIGLNDEGRAITDIVNKFIVEEPEGDCLLFQVVCLVYDYLDNCDIGECNICSEELKNFDYSGKSLTLESVQKFIPDLEQKLYGLKTPCSHCFHMVCLSKWAAIKVVQNDNNKKGDCWIKERDSNIIRSLEGSIRGEENEMKVLSDQKKLLFDIINEKEIVLLNMKATTEENEKKIEKIQEKEEKSEKLKTMNSKNIKKKNVSENNKMNILSIVSQSNIELIVQNHQFSMKENRTKLSDLVISIQKCKSQSDKIKLNEETVFLRKKISEDELILEEYLTKSDKKEISKECSALKEEEIILQRSKDSLVTVNLKLLKTEKKLIELSSELFLFRENFLQKNHEKSQNCTFPCAYCRTELSSSSCFLGSGDNNEKIVFDRLVELAVLKERSEQENRKKE